MADMERVHCPRCKERVNFKLSSLPVEGLDDVEAVGIVCTACGHRQHAYFDTPALVTKRLEVKQKRVDVARERGQRSAEVRLREYKQLVSAYNLLFDSVQTDVRRKLRERK